MARTTTQCSRLIENNATDPERDSSEGTAAWAAQVLAEQAMPPEEVSAILSTADSRVIRRHLALHLERLEESLSVQRRTIERIEKLLTGDSAVYDDTRA